MPDNTPAQIVVAAGGLGTRVHQWARHIPKEYYPVDGRPGIIHLLEEIGALGPARVVIVYHPYYGRFANWARQVLSRDDPHRYAREAGMDIPAAVPPGVTVDLIPQHGPYGDLTSILNGADRLTPADCLYVAFADNLYTGPPPLTLLRDAPGDEVAVLASRYRPALASSHGILITRPGPLRGRPQVQALVEKPDGEQARELEETHGPENLLMLEGRVRTTSAFLDFARTRQHASPGTEPRIALAIGAYAREHRVVAVPVPGDVIDLGAAEVTVPAIDGGTMLLAGPGVAGA
jgi:UTP-glucose-1-phosphate uridylyltransferase